MADPTQATPQPGWLQGLGQWLVNKIGLGGAAAQGGAGVAAPTSSNPWVAQPAAQAPAQAPQSNDYLKGIIDAQQHIKQLPADSKKKVVGPQSSLTDLFKSIVNV